MSSSAPVPTQPVAPADPNALAPQVWPDGAHRDLAGRLTIGGADAVALAARFGTPLYVVDEAVARARAVRIRSALQSAAAGIGTTATVYYAGKAFLSGAIVRWMTAEGLAIDVATGGELAVALAAGADPARIGFHGNNKSEREIERAVAAGVGTIILDSEIEVERVAEAAGRSGRVQRVRLRVNSGVHASTHEFLATAHEDQKFGVPLADAPRVVRAIRSHDSLDFVGLHCHIGSQIFDAAGFAESAERLLGVHAELSADAPVPELNLGGGFGIAYTEADDPQPIEVIADGIASAVASASRRHGVPVPKLAFEPGRSIIGPAGVTLYRVGTVKAVPTDDGWRHYVSVDGGMSDNIRTALYGARYTARLASRTSDAPPALVRVVGKHCESGDIVVDQDWLPHDVTPGDLLAVAATGAYCWSLASNYNHVPRPPVVAVVQGRARVIVRGETEDDLLARDAGLDDHDDAHGVTA
ncbi:diaminopimelate decarboxylase [Agromyces flavus]|uniref:Diaminopimelate decarboxylase n=1 Tax=Agromyces flavus TaxID=589382 RepID=A0A1H1U1T1_9MICO|nr:diaminopimelate decarboxylase [Agromyces flavus]MCP2368307.1 diaminopimelate decarboxylase [Agromyces flavus]GGI47768.1 diaminopimelate decarboxylase [Agromyces flavus]SDS66447.1 diaminopimelate decarboxylase [Agromyces flavus]